MSKDVLGQMGRHTLVNLEGTSQEVTEYVRNTLTFDGSPRYLWGQLSQVHHQWCTRLL